MPHPDTTTSADRALRVAETPADAVTMSSREIAHLVESRHDKVKQSIERLVSRGVIAQPPLGDEQETATTPTGGSRNYTTSVYLLGKRDSYVVVAQLSPEFTARLVDRWAELEDAAQRPAIDLNDPAAMRGYLLTYTEKVLALEATVESARPKARFYDSFVNADGLYGLQNAGRALGCHPNKFVAWLKQKYVFYQGSNLIPYTEYRQSGLFEVKVTVEGDRSFLRAFVTPKGLTYFASRVPADIKINAPHLELVG